MTIATWIIIQSICTLMMCLDKKRSTKHRFMEEARKRKWEKRTRRGWFGMARGVAADTLPPFASPTIVNHPQALSWI
jgi:hypothetical protein